MRKTCPSRYKTWVQSQTQNDIIEKKQINKKSNCVDENYFYNKIAKKNDFSSNIKSIFVAIKLPTNVFIYEWFQKDIKFKILKNFVLSMDISHEFSDDNNNFTFVDLIYEKYEFFDDQMIDIVFQKEKEAIKCKAIPNSNICPSNRIFLKVKMPPCYNKFIFSKKKS